MPELRVEARSGAYPVVIEPGISSRVGGLVREMAGSAAVLVVCDHNTAEVAGSRVAADAGAAVLELDPGEALKSVQNLELVCAAAAGHGLERASVIVAVGGGVIGDLAGTAAAIYLRGIRLVHVPTTLLAMVDSSIGGKVGVNLGAGKNLVGAFKPPAAVLVDPTLLAGLPEREFRSGMTEVIKSGLIADPGLVALLQRERDAVLAKDAQTLLEVITRTCAVKVGVVSRDEHETGERAILNYGHTVGHALEAASGYSPELTHGEAVSVGMMAAARVGITAGVTPEDVLPLQERLLTSYGLPLRSPLPLEANQVMSAMGHDKKVVGGRVRWVLLEGVGRAAWGQEVDTRIVDDALASVLAPG